MSAQVPEDEFLSRWEKRQNLDSDDFSDLARLTRNTTLLHREWFAANERRTKLRWEWYEFFKDYDVVLAPVTPVCAFPHDQNPKISERVLKVNGKERPYNDLFFWAGLSCVSYLPSTVLPTGLGEAGLPIGIQVIGAEMQDLKTIRFAQLIDQQLNGFVPPEKYAV
jgi:amidase